MKRAIECFVAIVFAAFCAAGCSTSPGRPDEASIPVDPDQVLTFPALFAQNCSGCHGTDGKNGAAVPIGTPEYRRYANYEVIHKAIAEGVGGTSMPAFAKSAGGMLTEKQVETLAKGVAGQKGDALEEWPAYADASAGDAAHGAEAYATFCASCHGPNGKGSAKGSSIVDGTFLALVSDRALRTMIVIGRPDLGAPNFRNNVAGRPMTSQEISDVVAWLSAQRPKFAGQPYPAAQTAAPTSTGVHP